MTELSHAQDYPDAESRSINAPSGGPSTTPVVEFDDNVRILEPRRLRRAMKRPEAAPALGSVAAAEPPAPEPVGESEHYGPVRSASMTVEDAKRIAAQAHVVAQTGSTLGTFNPVQRRAKRKQAEEAERRLALIRERQERERKEKAQKPAKEPKELKAEKPAKEPKVRPTGSPSSEKPSTPDHEPETVSLQAEPIRAVIVGGRRTANADAARKAAEKAASKQAAADVKAAAAAAKEAAKRARATARAEADRLRREARAAAKVKVVADDAAAPPELATSSATTAPPPSGAPVDLPPPPTPVAPADVTSLAGRNSRSRSSAPAEDAQGPIEKKAGRDWHKIFFGESKKAPASDGSTEPAVTVEKPAKRSGSDSKTSKSFRKKGKSEHKEAAVFDPKAREASGAVGVTVRVAAGGDQFSSSSEPTAQPAPVVPEETAAPSSRVAVFAPVTGGALRAVNQPRAAGPEPLMSAPAQPTTQAQEAQWDPAFLPPQLMATMGVDINWMRVRRPVAASMAALQQHYTRSLVPSDPIVGVVLRAVSRALRPQPAVPTPVSADQVAYEVAVRPHGGRRRKDGPPMLGADGARDAAALGRRIESGQGGSLVNAADAAELIARLSDSWDVASVLRHPEIATWAYDEAVANVQKAPKPRRGKGPDKKKVLAELNEAKRILDGIQDQRLIATTHA